MKRVVTAMVPVEIDAPAEMEHALLEVLGGEYDAPFFGTELTILDIGANVGAFSIWATLRWPRSTVHAYEPHPGTFELLLRNVRHLPSVVPTNVAVFPSENPDEPLYSRFDGDGEAGLVAALRTTWSAMPEDRIMPVPVVHPGTLPRADIVKVDAEGSEGAIIEHLQLEDTTLLLVEYQTVENLERITAVTRSRFAVERHVSFPWGDDLARHGYRRELERDRYGTIVLVNPSSSRLRRTDATVGTATPAPASPGRTLRHVRELVVRALRVRAERAARVGRRRL